MCGKNLYIYITIFSVIMTECYRLIKSKGLTMRITTQKQHIEKSKIYIFIPDENTHKKVFYATLSDKPYKNPFVTKTKTPRMIRAKDIVKYSENNIKK